MGLTGPLVGEMVVSAEVGNWTPHRAKDCLADELTMTITGVRFNYCAPWCNAHPQTTERTSLRRNQTAFCRLRAYHHSYAYTGGGTPEFAHE